MAFCVVVDEARVAGDALWGRGRVGRHGNGISVLSAGHHGVWFGVVRIWVVLKCGVI